MNHCNFRETTRHTASRDLVRFIRCLYFCAHGIPALPDPPDQFGPREYDRAQTLVDS